MGISLHKRFENYMDVSSSETIGDAEEIEEWLNDDLAVDLFKERLADAKRTKEEQIAFTPYDEKENNIEDIVIVPRKKKKTLKGDKSAHMGADNQEHDNKKETKRCSGFDKVDK